MFSGASVKTGSDSAFSSPGLLIAACLFAVVGGYMDAYSYIAHDHLFANAQTGNVVLIGIYASNHEWARAARYLPPIGAFMLGVAVARFFGAKTEKQTFKATLICQGLEAAVLLLLVAKRIANDWVVPLISFCAALQNTSFGAIGPWAFNSAMTTGNIRNGISGLVWWLTGYKAEENRTRAMISFSVFAGFAVGAVLGGVYTRVDAAHALGPCVFLVLAGMLVTWRQRVADEEDQAQRR